MTVKELIKALKTFPEDLPVFRADGEYGDDEIDILKLTPAVMNAAGHLDTYIGAGEYATHEVVLLTTKGY